MQINLDPKQMDYLRRQAEATELLAKEVAKLRKVAMETQIILAAAVEAIKAAKTS